MITYAVHRVSLFLRTLAGAMLVGMMLLTCADVVGNFFGSPVLGSEEVVSLMASLLIAFALPITHEEKGHIGIDLLYMRFPPRLKRANNVFIHFISSLFFLATFWECYLYAGELKRSGEVSPTLELPTYYITYAISFACLILAVVIFLECLHHMKEDHNE